MTLKTLAILIVITNGLSASAQTYDTNGDFVQTFAGSGFSGYVDGVGQLTMFSSPNQIAVDSRSNLFVWDSGNSRIRKISPDGTVTTFAGGGGQPIGTGTNAFFSVNHIYGMIVDKNDTIWMTDPKSSGVLHKITSDASVSEITLTGISWPWGICADSLNNFYVSDYSGNKIFKCDTNGTTSVFVGSGNAGAIDGNGIFTSFNRPSVLVCDSGDNIYVWDAQNYLIRRIDQSRNVMTIAGTGTGLPFTKVDGFGTNASFYGGIDSMCADSVGNIYIAGYYSIRKMDATTNVVTLAGSFTDGGYVNGLTNVARFNGAVGICRSGGVLFVADSVNQRIRSLINNPLPQVVSGANLGIGTFAGVTITGVVGRTYQIQSSPDLNAWTTQATMLLNSSPYLWIDQNPIAGNKFYQAVMLP